MPNVSSLIIQYANEIRSQDVPLFRGAVIASMEKKNVLLHNHEDNRLRYSYPLIQYKCIHKKAAVMGVGKGVEVISQILTAQNFNYKIGHEQLEMKIESVNAFENEILLSEGIFYQYRLHNWLPLNSGNYKKYQNSGNMVERVMMLERVLTGNILSLLKGLDIHLEEKLELNITDIKGQHIIKYKDVGRMAFDIEFKANMILPQYIGIGKSASVGYGMLTIIAN